IRCLAFFPDGTKVATGSDDSTVCVLDARTGKTLTSYTAHRRTVWHVAVSPDGKYVGSYGLEGCINVWDAEKEQNYATEKVRCGFGVVAFSKSHLFVGDKTAMKLFDLKTKKLSDLR